MKNKMLERRSLRGRVSRIDARGLVALGIDLHQKLGTPAEAEARQMLEDAKQMWREQTKPKCPHCGQPMP